MATAGRYQALRKIADGGTAEVFLAEQAGAAGFRRLVVLKRIRSSLYADEEFRRMLVEEAHLAMGLHHANLVQVLDLGEAQGRYFMVLELVDGWTVEQLLKRMRATHVPLPPALAVYVCAEVCRALAYAHDRTQAGVRLNIVHRDVCPNNVMVSSHAEVKLADFGIARARGRSRITGTGMVMGKPSFMSPEQASGESVDRRSDLFSVGTLLYYLLTDELPFKAPSDRELLIRVASGIFTSPAKLKPSLPKELVALVLKTMARNPDERFQTATELLGALEKVQRAELEPAGRSELEAWLKALTAKDGQVPVTRESMPPDGEQPEWIELTAEDLRSTTNPRLPNLPPPPPTRWVRLGLLFAVAVVGAIGLWQWQRAEEERAPEPAPVAVVEGPAPEPEPEPEPTVAAEPEAVAEVEAVPTEAVAEVELPDAAVEEPAPELPVIDVTPEPKAPTPPPKVEEAKPHPKPVPAPPPPPAPVKVASAPVSAGVVGLTVTARVVPPAKGQAANRPLVMLESSPNAAGVWLGKREMGKTPITLKFNSGVAFEVTFKSGRKSLVQWLTVTEKSGKARVSLRAPPD